MVIEIWITSKHQRMNQMLCEEKQKACCLYVHGVELRRTEAWTARSRHNSSHWRSARLLLSVHAGTRWEVNTVVNVEDSKQGKLLRLRRQNHTGDKRVTNSDHVTLRKLNNTSLSLSKIIPVIDSLGVSLLLIYGHFYILNHYTIWKFHHEH